MAIHFCQEQDYPDIESVSDAYPSAAEVIEVEGGWAVFDTYDDYNTWTRQV